MLAPNDDPLKNKDFFKQLQYPLLCSPKLDGIRCIVKNRQCLSRTLLALPSKQVQQQFNTLLEFDGEIIVGEPTDNDVYNRTQSAVMSRDKTVKDLRYYVFDIAAENKANTPFHSRLGELFGYIEQLKKISPNVFFVHHSFIRNEDDLLEYEQHNLALGYEGIMMRDPRGRYKHGRGTFNEGLIYKLKRFTDDEALIIGFEVQMINNNTLEVDERGYAKRSSSKEGLTEGNRVGKIICLYKDATIEVAPGSFTHEQLKEMWYNSDNYIGQLCKFRYFSHGIKDKPRFPRATGLRDNKDL